MKAPPFDSTGEIQWDMVYDLRRTQRVLIRFVSAQALLLILVVVLLLLHIGGAP